MLRRYVDINTERTNLLVRPWFPFPLFPPPTLDPTPLFDPLL